MQSDERSFRIAVVANDLVNSAQACFDLLEVLGRCSWGAIVLPPAWYPSDVAYTLLMQFAEHVEEFVRHRYEVVCIGDCGALAEPLRQLGVAMPESITPGDEAELTSFLRHPRTATSGA